MDTTAIDSTIEYHRVKSRMHKNMCRKHVEAELAWSGLKHSTLEGSLSEGRGLCWQMCQNLTNRAIEDEYPLYD